MNISLLWKTCCVVYLGYSMWFPGPYQQSYALLSIHWPCRFISQALSTAPPQDWLHGINWCFMENRIQHLTPSRITFQGQTNKVYHVNKTAVGQNGRETKNSLTPSHVLYATAWYTDSYPLSWPWHCSAFHFDPASSVLLKDGCLWYSPYISFSANMRLIICGFNWVA